VNIRNVRAGDADLFIKIYAESYKGLEKYAYTNEEDIREYFKWLFSRDPEGFLIIEIDEPVGFIACDKTGSATLRVRF